MRKAKTFIQNIHHFRDEYLSDGKPPCEKVVIFDEAQRAWDAAKGKSKFDYEISEPEMFLQLMERHKDWAVIIALVGNGQEINTGERGLIDWGSSLNERANDKDKKPTEKIIEIIKNNNIGKYSTNIFLKK